jgi:hypothetical protein
MTVTTLVLNRHSVLQCHCGPCSLILLLLDGCCCVHRVLVLAVHDAGGLEAPDLTGLVSGLVATCMQAGYHQLKALGVDVLNLWPSVAGVNPLNFRVPRDQARDVVAASQALAEAFAVERMAPQVGSWRGGGAEQGEGQS